MATSVPGAPVITLMPRFNLQRRIDEHRHLLRPPVGNKCMVDGDFIVMIVGGPNARTDYHHEAGPEFFHQIEGDIALMVQDDAVAREIALRAAEAFYVPQHIPHSPNRAAGSIGLVIERRRLPGERGGLMWFCASCNRKLCEE